VICEFCGERLESSGRTTSKRRFCDDRCRYAARDRKRHVQRGTRREAVCKRCGDPFEYASTTRPRLYCDCCRGGQQVIHPPRRCVECGAEFVPNRADRLVCSDSCLAGRKVRQKRQSRAAKRVAYSRNEALAGALELARKVVA
jgi:predicted nucleic acid-binding Zn ribbon protein